MKKVLVLIVVSILFLSACVFDEDNEQKTVENVAPQAVSQGIRIQDVGQKITGGFVITESSERGMTAKGNLKVTGNFFIKEGPECAYNCGEVCVIADQALPWGQEFCFANNLLKEKVSGRAEMIVTTLGVPYEGAIYAEVEQVKVLEGKSQDVKPDEEKTIWCTALTGGKYLCSIEEYNLNFITKATEAVLHTQYSEDYQHSIVSFDKDIDIYIGKYTDLQKLVDPMYAGDFNPREDIFQPFDFTVDGNKAYLSENPKGWCDGMGCSKPYVVCGFIKDGAWYAITFFGNGLLDKSEKEFLNNIKFIK